MRRTFTDAFSGELIVSIHASVKDATKSHRNGAFVHCFNPRICKRCDIKKFICWLKINVSIHASVKDATKWGGLQFLSIDVSIHASVKDATPTFNALVVILIGFNPRICKRCDLWEVY